MAFPFSLSCDCCRGCRPCPCDDGTTASSLQFTFDDWSASPDGYCHSCADLNATIEVPAVDDFHYGTELGDAYVLTVPKIPCGLEPPAGFGCSYAVDDLFDCVPQTCLDGCLSQCAGICTDDVDCAPENCEDYLCGSTGPCSNFGGPCEVRCEQSTVCVFNDEFDPEHLAGICATVGDCTSSVVEGTCRKIRLRIRAIFYVTIDRRAAVSVQILLFGRTVGGAASALNLYGFHEFEEETLDCGAVDVDVPLYRVDDYSQPSIPPCGEPTRVRITGLP